MICNLDIQMFVLWFDVCILPFWSFSAVYWIYYGFLAYKIAPIVPESWRRTCVSCVLGAERAVYIVSWKTCACASAHLRNLTRQNVTMNRAHEIIQCSECVLRKRSHLNPPLREPNIFVDKFRVHAKNTWLVTLVFGKDDYAVNENDGSHGLSSLITPEKT